MKPVSAGVAPQELSVETSLNAFADVCAQALDHLQRAAPMGLWTVLVRDGEDCVVAAVAGRDGADAGISAGGRVPWSSTISARMTQGRGPRVAPDVRRVPAYAEAPVVRRLPVGAYVGVPLTDATGTVFGSLCGLDVSPQTGELGGVLLLAELLGRVLSQVHTLADVAAAERDRADQAERRAVTDALTGITNRRGWDEALASEQARATRHGLWSGIVSIDLNYLKQVNDSEGHHVGDELLRAAAKLLQEVVRREDVLARVGGDEFAVLATDCGAECLQRLLLRLRQVLDHRHVAAAIGGITVPAGTNLRTGWKQADQRMYAEKSRLRSVHPVAG